MIGSILGGLAQLPIDLFVEDEDQRRAMKAAVWASVAVVSGASGIDGGSAAVAAALCAKEVGLLGCEDEKLERAIDAGGAILAASGGELGTLAQSAVGAGVGASVSAALDEDPIEGLSLGASIGVGTAAEVGAKVVGAGLGGGIAAAAAEDGDERDAWIRHGVAVGSRVGAGILDATVDGDTEQATLQRLRGVRTLAAELSGHLAGEAIRRSRGCGEDEDALSAFTVGSAIGNALGSLGGLAASEATPPALVETSASVAEAVLASAADQVVGAERRAHAHRRQNGLEETRAEREHFVELQNEERRWAEVGRAPRQIAQLVLRLQS